MQWKIQFSYRKSWNDHSKFFSFTLMLTLFMLFVLKLFILIVQNRKSNFGRISHGFGMIKCDIKVKISVLVPKTMEWQQKFFQFYSNADILCTQSVHHCSFWLYKIENESLEGFYSGLVWQNLMLKWKL